MNKLERDNFLIIITAKYYSREEISKIVDPWEGQPVPRLVSRPPKIIREMQIFQAIKNVKGVAMYPGSYKVELPSSAHTYNPWGPVVRFVYQTAFAKDQSWLRPKGNEKIIKEVEDKLHSALSDYIHAIGTEYDGNGFYTVEITQKADAPSSS